MRELYPIINRDVERIKRIRKKTNIVLIVYILLTIAVAINISLISFGLTLMPKLPSFWTFISLFVIPFIPPGVRLMMEMKFDDDLRSDPLTGNLDDKVMAYSFYFMFFLLIYGSALILVRVPDLKNNGLVFIYAGFIHFFSSIEKLDSPIGYRNFRRDKMWEYVGKKIEEQLNREATYKEVKEILDHYTRLLGKSKR
jgi:hypothetical protein